MNNTRNTSENIEKGLSIIVPVVDEERNITQLVKRITSTLNAKKYSFEIIIIDDHSTDKTVSLIKSLAKKYPIKLYQKKGKKGKAYSLLEGFTYAKYGLVAMIDADLQYPPEEIPKMVEKINDSVGVVVADRKIHKSSLLRKILSYGFSLFFARFLHGLDHDVQSGLKVFKKEIIERIDLNPGPWSFDLEFLIKAKHAGYLIENHQITFEKRQQEKPKIALLPATWEIGISALKLAFLSPHTIPFHPKQEKGKGFHFKGVKFIHHSNLPLLETAFRTLVLKQKLILLNLALVIIIGFVADWRITSIILVAIITAIYFVDLLLNLFLILRGFVKKPEIHVLKQEVEKLDQKKLPKYTILCPLYNEWEVLPQFVTAISRIDYPKDKLQVLLLLEEDDKETIRHALSYKLPDYFEVVVVPDSLPKTKPKALNYGLQMAIGEYVVIYDAEDVPDPRQLKKVILAFAKAGKRTVCIQAKLNFYNPHHNLLTRIFTAEYSLWFDLVLTGLQSIFAPIPLGGTSNHFKLQDLKKLRGWDSFNVTEDCDLGMRLAKRGYQTALINSVTLEEANSDLKNWFLQRTRWIKGYIQTYLVHMRNPKEFVENTSQIKMFIFQMFVGGKVLFLFFNPLMWITTFLYFAFRPIAGPFIEQFFPGPVLYLGVFSLVFGNFLYMYSYMIGCVKRGHYDLVKYVFLVPFYWLCMSIAAWQALVQLIRRPHFWPKTVHGFHFDSDRAFKQATEIIKKKLIDRSIATAPVSLAPAFAKAKKSNLFETWSKKNLTSGGFLLVSMMLGNFLNLLFNVYLGRTISFEDFGLITLINTFWYLLGIFASPLGASINHRTAFISAKYGQGSAVSFFKSSIKKVTKISLIVSVVWFLTSPILAGFFKLQNVLPILLFTPAIIFAFLGSMSEGYLNGSFYFVVIGIIVIITAVVKIGSAVLLVNLNQSTLTYIAIPFSIVISAIAARIFLYTKIRKIQADNKKHFNFPKRFFVASIVSGFSVNAFLTFDVILTKHFLSPRLAGEYAFLSLVGKMIYFFGSMLGTFIIPFVSRDLGANRDPNKSFYRILTATTLLTTAMYIAVGFFGKYFLPLIFGAKVSPILPYINLYSLAIAMYVITSTIVGYHLTRYHYVFPATALLLSFIMSIGIILFHNTVADIVMVVLISSMISLDMMVLLHLLMRKGKFFIKNLVDLAGLFLPLPKVGVVSGTGKRILIFNWRDTKHKFAGGAEVYIHELAKRWVKAGNQVTVFCGNDGNCLRNEVIDGVQIIRRGGFYFVYIWAFLYYVLKFRGRYDVIIDSENGIPFFTPLYSGEKKFLLIHHVHQEVFRKTLVPPLSWIAEFLEMKLMPSVYKNIQTITVSPSSKKEILEKQLTEVEPIIVYNGVDLKTYKPAEKSSIPLVLYIGRLKYYKSLHIFLHSAKKILEKLPEVKFIIAGDGEEKNGLMKLAKKLNIFEKIRFLGRVSEVQKIKLYQKAWVFVNPSFMEGWGITTIEANACATPVVAADVPGLRDSVNNPHSGFLVPYGSINEFSTKIIELIKDDSLRAKMSIEGLSWAQQFDWQKSADKSLELFI